MRILFTHVFTAHNKGDAGIVSGMMGEFHRLYPKAAIVISAMEQPQINPYAAQHAKLISSFFYEAIYVNQHPFARIWNTIGVSLSSLMWALFYRVTHFQANWLVSTSVLKILNEYVRADMIVPVGGCYLRGTNSVQSWVTIILQLHSILISRLLQKPTYLYSQSIGPFGHPLQAGLVAQVLQQVQLIFAREDITFATLQKMGLPASLIERGIDAGFLLEVPQNLKRKVTLNVAKKQNQKLIGITVREWLEPRAQANYEQVMADLADWIIKTTKSQVIFIPQVTATEHNDDDRICAIRVGQLVTNHKLVKVLTEELSHYEIKALYDSLDLFIGTRMHSNIFSLTSFVPLIAIEYEYKTRGIMRDLGLEEWVIKMEQVTLPKMKKLFTKLLKQETGYRTYLKQKMPPYIHEVQQTANRIKEHFENHFKLNQSKKVAISS